MKLKLSFDTKIRVMDKVTREEVHPPESEPEPEKESGPRLPSPDAHSAVGDTR
jgi:hypothetical protein